METVGSRDVATDAVSTTFFWDGLKTVFGAFFVPRAKTSFQFFFTSVPLQRTASYCSVVKNFQVFVPTSTLLGVQFGRSTPTHRRLYCVNGTAFVTSSIVCQFRLSLFVSTFGVLRAGQANRALTIEVHTHRFLHVHSPNNSSHVQAPIRVPHDATECEGEVLNPCRAQEMTVSDTVCCSNYLCRSICHRSAQFV